MNPHFTGVHGIVLAAGASSRMGSPKALLEYRGRTFLEWVLEALRPACDSIAVVTAPDSTEVRALCGKSGIETLINPAPERGMLSSLQCAIAAHDAASFLFTPVDYPNLSPATAAAIVAAFQSASQEAVIPVFAGKHGHPVCISRALARRILELPAQASARDALHTADALYLPVDDSGVLLDVDTPAEYEALTLGDRP